MVATRIIRSSLMGNSEDGVPVVVAFHANAPKQIIIWRKGGLLNQNSGNFLAWNQPILITRMGHAMDIDIVNVTLAKKRITFMLCH